MCKYEGGRSEELLPPKECQLFHLSMTNDGIGYTFNNANFWDMFSKTNYTELYAKLMTPKGFDQDPALNICNESDENMSWLCPKKDILFPHSSGPIYGLRVIIT